MKKIEIDREEAQEGEVVQTFWDIKKIGGGLFVLAVLAIAGSYIFFPKGGSVPLTATLGASTENLTPTPALPSKEDVQGIVNDAQKTLSQITSDNLTSSQAAIQQVITSLQELQQKKNVMGAICSIMCKDK